jgi:cytochrome P450
VTSSDDVFYNPLEPGYVDNPFPYLAEMREHQPVHHTLAGPWALFRYDDVFRLLRDPALSVEDRNADLDESRVAMFEAVRDISDDDIGGQSMLSTDPPDHTRLRGLVSKAFTHRRIEALRPMVQALVDEALDRMADMEQSNLVDELAFPLPFDVIAQMLGMPAGDKLEIRGWSEAMVKTLDAFITPDEAAAAYHASRAMTAHLDEVIAWKRANPGDDLLTAMLEAEEGGDRLTMDELRDQVVLLFIAGHETTVNLIGNGIHALLEHPDQWALWRDDPSIEVGAVEELLRFVSPVQFSRRITLTDIEFGGKTIPGRSGILACLASANRDQAKWGPTADALDLRREIANQHVSFGSGVHYCLGASLAKLEAQVAIGTFIRRFPDAEITGDLVWNGRMNLRGLSELPVSVR